MKPHEQIEAAHNLIEEVKGSLKARGKMGSFNLAEALAMRAVEERAAWESLVRHLQSLGKMLDE